MAAIQSLVFQMDQTQWWPSDRLRAQQLRLIHILVGHAAATVPYYRRRLADLANLDSDAFTMDAFRQIPVLKRTDVQEAGETLVTNTLPRGHGPMFDVRTTGSTGRPIEVKGTRLTSLMSAAMGLRYHQWHRRDLGAFNVTMRAVKGKQTVVGPRVWTPGIPGGRSLVCDITLPIAKLYDIFTQANAAYLQTHPYTLLGMIRHSVEIGVKPDRLREVRTFGEPVDDALRAECRKEWNVPITDMYSSTELNAIALQCPHHLHYHVQSENVLVEILDDDEKPCPPGQVGRVVLTAINNFATPLIRYELGDFAELGAPCPCGRGLPVLKNIVGRVRNLLVLPSGDRVFPDFAKEPVLSTLPIRQFQLTQRSLENIEVKLVVERPFTEEDEKELRDYFTRLFRFSFNYNLLYVDAIPRSTGGKFETFRTEVSPT